MEIEGSTKNWEHFTEKIYFERLLDLHQNIFLLGQKYSGKTSLLNECIQQQNLDQQKVEQNKTKKILKFNCLIFQSIVELRKKIVQQIYLANSDQDRYKRNYTTLVQLEKVQRNQSLKNTLIKFNKFSLIIENAEHLIEIANFDHIKKFFSELKYYLLESSYNFNFQIIIVSTQDLPFPGDCFYQFTLPLPSDQILENFVSNKIEEYLLADKHNKYTQHIANQIEKEKNQLLKDIMAYTTIAKDFLSFRALTENLYELKKILWQKTLDKDKEENSTINQKVMFKGRNTYREVINYYFYNFARIFQPVQEVYNQIKDFERLHSQNKEFNVNGVDQKLQLVNSNKNFINKIPLTAQFLLAAFGLAIKINPKSDLQIFLGYNRKRKQKKRQINVIQKVQKKKRQVKLSRVVAICELLMSRSVMNNESKQIDRTENYHSIEFYLNVDFLEKLKLVKKSNLIARDQNFDVNIGDQILEITLKGLGFKIDEFYQLSYSLIIIQIQR